MAKQGHTPGPWHVEEGLHQIRHYVVYIGPRNAAKDVVCVGGAGGPDDVHAEDGANALLIAAAPDLLAALKDAAERASERDDKVQLAELNAVINKAEKGQGNRSRQAATSRPGALGEADLSLKEPKA